MMKGNRKRISHSNQKIFGVHAVTEAIQSGKQIDRVFLKKGSDNPRIKELQSTVKHHNIPFSLVPEEKLYREAGDKHQGVIAICAIIEYELLEEIIASIYERGENPLILLLDGITDVRNFGGICRTAECMGVHAVVIPDTGSAPISAEAIKISSGALHNLSVCRTSSMNETMRFLQDSGVTVVGASEKATELIQNFDFCQPMAIVMGAEGKGLSHAAIRRATHLLRIPMTGQTSSLNVGIAASMFMYECMRQRTGAK